MLVGNDLPAFNVKLDEEITEGIQRQQPIMAN
jgi:hypothetical protein